MAFRVLTKDQLKKNRTRSPDPVKEILGALLKRHGLDREIDRYRFVLHWREIVGEEIAKRTRPECIRNGSLVIRVKSSAWAQELTFQKPAILARLQRFLGSEDSVKDIFFQVGAG